MKYYHMIIARSVAENAGDKSTRKEYISSKQGAAPDGWICLGVCGFHEAAKTNKRIDKETEA